MFAPKVLEHLRVRRLAGVVAHVDALRVPRGPGAHLGIRRILAVSASVPHAGVFYAWKLLVRRFRAPKSSQSKDSQLAPSGHVEPVARGRARGGCRGGSHAHAARGVRRSRRLRERSSRGTHRVVRAQEL